MKIGLETVECIKWLIIRSEYMEKNAFSLTSCHMEHGSAEDFSVVYYLRKSLNVNLHHLSKCICMNFIYKTICDVVQQVFKMIVGSFTVMGSFLLFFNHNSI